MHTHAKDAHTTVLQYYNTAILQYCNITTLLPEKGEKTKRAVLLLKRDPGHLATGSSEKAIYCSTAGFCVCEAGGCYENAVGPVVKTEEQRQPLWIPYSSMLYIDRAAL